MMCITLTRSALSFQVVGIIHFFDFFFFFKQKTAYEIPDAKQDQHTQPQLGGEPTRSSEGRSAPRSFNRVFSGKASYYSYRTGKTASGSLFDRNLPTAAHRSLPFGTRVRVTDLATSKSVVVRITDHGPTVRGRVMDIPLGGA